MYFGCPKKWSYNYQEGYDQILKKVKISPTDIQLSLGIGLTQCVHNQTFFVDEGCEEYVPYSSTFLFYDFLLFISQLSVKKNFEQSCWALKEFCGVRAGSC